MNVMKRGQKRELKKKIKIEPFKSWIHVRVLLSHHPENEYIVFSMSCMKEVYFASLACWANSTFFFFQPITCSTNWHNEIAFFSFNFHEFNTHTFIYSRYGLVVWNLVSGKCHFIHIFITGGKNQEQIKKQARVWLSKDNTNLTYAHVWHKQRIIVSFFFHLLCMKLKIHLTCNFKIIIRCGIYTHSQHHENMRFHLSTWI